MAMQRRNVLIAPIVLAAVLLPMAIADRSAGDIVAVRERAVQAAFNNLADSHQALLQTTDDLTAFLKVHVIKEADAEDRRQQDQLKRQSPMSRLWNVGLVGWAKTNKHVVKRRAASLAERYRRDKAKFHGSFDDARDALAALEDAYVDLGVDIDDVRTTMRDIKASTGLKTAALDAVIAGANFLGDLVA